MVQDDAMVSELQLYPFLFTPTVMYERNGFAVTFLMDVQYLKVEKPEGYQNATKTTFEDVIRFYEDNEPKGEYVLVISGKTFETKEQEAREAWESLSVEEHMAHYEASGMERKEAMKQVAKDRGISKRDVYQALLKQKLNSLPVVVL